MYLFAHLFSGILIALGFFSLYHDRRAFPVCIAGALLPDLLDKPLTVLLPSVFGSTRTVGHTLLLGTVLLLAGILLWSSRRSILGVLFAGSVLSHQVLDMLWNLPVVWFFPLNGMFPFTTGPGSLWYFLLLELTNPSEWVFALASGILVLRWCTGSRVFRPSSLSGRWHGLLLYGFACLLFVTGAFLISTGMIPASAPFPPSPDPDKTLMAGLVAFCGAYVFVTLPGMNRHAER